MNIIDLIKKWWGARQCRKGRHLWVYDYDLWGKAKLDDIYKRCSRSECNCEGKLTTNLAVVAFNSHNVNMTDICEVLSESNDVLEDVDWVQIKEAG